ncbi:MAG: xanthine dehydrogenase family protein molybdopterin-binding subunit [Sneathiella sp.]
MTLNTSRRNFLVGVSASASVLVVGLTSTDSWAASNTAAEITPFIKIDKEGTVTAILKHFEMGQGTTTGLTTLIAEELDADWDKIQIEFAPADGKRYANLLFGAQGTGGSTSIANSYLQYRKAGASARDVLIRAAAAKWSVSPSTVDIQNGLLVSGSHKAHFGEVIDDASKLNPSAEPKLKSRADFRLIGNASLSRKDSHSKTDGSAIFAMDVKVPNMVYASVTHSPKFGGTALSFDLSKAKDVPGYIDAKLLPTKTGVVVYAKNTWAVKQAREQLSIQWDFSKAETRSSDAMVTEHKKLLDTPEFSATKDTNFEATGALLASAETVVEADFLLPFLSHEPMETLNCVIEPTANGVRVYDGSQFPGLTQPTVAAILKLKPEQVEIKTVYAGGSFGRRANGTSDYEAEAAMAFALLGGKTPVKLVWMREDQVAGGYYRPMAAHRIKIGADANGKIVGWDHRTASKSIMKGTPFAGGYVHEGVDHASVEGIADTLYSIPGFSVGLSDFKSPISVLWWRSVGHSHTAFAMESALDMVATDTKKDPVTLRLSLLNSGSKDHMRASAVIKLAAEKAGWDKPLAKNRGRGFAMHKSFNSYVAEVAEVSINSDGSVKIEKITCAVDCGVAVNPDVIKAQMEGGIGYGLGAAMRNEITFTDGVVDQSNFPDYEPIRMSDFPEIDVHIVQSDENPTGVGEPGLPPIAPAVANAIFAASGKRITSLPFSENGISFG